ncbi:uncharacterized protein LOC113368277 [Ctenocephalides felis]|uniref:uncharacterized protein LOC113367989 n=1 Tax=Ctenocephalides felis TaxID=7515 RepID=UPI000E6E52D3|nr:uncharacterized protein LOC113367989 [Ctenocephalides felis]XP_026465644.1 uncharacterized protein LOC113368277 [Ctenocephalides felis]
MIPRKSIDQVSPRQMRKRLMQAFNGCNNRESINLVENISTLTRDDGVRYDTILENDVYDYSQQNDQEDELEHKCVFEVEDESELDQPEEREVNFDEQVYENAPITVSNSMFLILMIFLRHNVSLECIADIIAVINLHCMKSRLVKNSLYKFRKYFSLDHSEFIKHYYCHFCGRVQLESDSICPSCPQKKNPYFIQLPFLEHLREMYKRDGFYSKLQDCHNKRINNNPDCISDVYDGVLYRKYVQKGFLCNPDNISFTWYTDGIPVFKSSKISAWPIYLTLNELPIKERKKGKIHYY